jgi:hypothetical protein
MILAPSSTPVATSAQTTKVPEAVSHLWLRLLELYPALRSAYVQVLVFVVVPLVLLVAVLVADLRVRIRVLAHDGSLTFRPSVAVRCAWFFGILALLSHPFASHARNWIIVAADLLASLELLRTFPRNLTLAPEGLRWSELYGSVSLPWEEISCFTRERSRFGAEYKLRGDAGQSFVVSPMVFPGSEQIIRRISLSLNQRHLNPSSAMSLTPLDWLHRVLLVASLIIVVLGNHLPGYK